MDALDREFLARCLSLAEISLAEGSAPFGSVLVSKTGTILLEARNRTAEGDPMLHPELEIARFAAARLTPEERASATVYTSGEHCPMCAAAHALVGLGRIVYGASAEQLASWLGEGGRRSGRVKPLPNVSVIENAVVEGPEEEFATSVRTLILAYAERRIRGEAGSRGILPNSR
jgi:tRNA(Arg) A34 adenosine deaminase TadA